jgi:N-acylneuraminate cytidylyltransferase/CMP-N,N'-diacetyllegionaminic acid synthase
MIAIIPARKGSKRLPGKNMMELCGKPLIYWTIQAAKGAFGKEDIIVSSDSKEILDYAGDLGVIIHERSKRLATEDASIFDVVREIISPDPDNMSFSEPIGVVILQPTSPLRTTSDIIDAKVQATIGGLYVNNIISLSVICKNIYRPNGAIYVVQSIDILQRNVQYQIAHIMPPERSIDIDTIEDFEKAERLMNERNQL